MKDDRNVGNKIRKIRKELNLSQQELAGDDFTKSYVSKIERGLANPSMKALEIFSQRLDKPISFFLEGKVNSSFNPNLILEGHKLYEQKKYKEGLTKLKETLKFKNQINNDQLIRIYHRIADIYFQQMKYKDCISYCKEALDIIEDYENTYAFKIYYILGESLYYIDNRQESLEVFLEAEKFLSNTDMEIDITIKLKIFADIATLYAQRGKTNISKKYFQNIIDISKKEKIITDIVLAAFGGLSEIATFIEKDTDKSLAYLNDNNVLWLYEYFDDYDELCNIYFKYIGIYFEKGDLSKTKHYLEKLKASFDYVNDSKLKQEIDVYRDLTEGKIYIKELKFDKAGELLKSSLEKSEKYQLNNTKIDVLLNLGRLYFNKGEGEKALEYLNTSEMLCQKLEFVVFLPEIYQLKGKIYIQLGEIEKGQGFYDKAFQQLKEQQPS